MNIAIRVDGNQKLGMGNIYRSMAIANELIKNNQKIHFITKSYPETLKVLQNNNFPFFLLSSSLYATSHENEISEIIKQNNIKMIINDIKDTDEAYMQTLKNLKIFIVNFDDLGFGRTYANILFDAFYQPKIPKVKSYENYGPEYLILRKEFQTGNNRIHPKKVHAITVLMGSSNTGRFLEKILKALAKLPKNIQCNIILSQATEKANVFQTDFNRKNFNYYYQPENISELFMKSDIAITAGGISMCETCALGTPTLVIPQVPHEADNAKLFEKKGAVKALNYDPDLSEENILHQLNQLIQDLPRRNDMSQRSRKLIDGRGIERVVNILKPYLLENN